MFATHSLLTDFLAKSAETRPEAPAVRDAHHALSYQALLMAPAPFAPEDAVAPAPGTAGHVQAAVGSGSEPPGLYLLVRTTHGRRGCAIGTAPAAAGCRRFEGQRQARASTAPTPAVRCRAAHAHAGPAVCGVGSVARWAGVPDTCQTDAEGLENSPDMALEILAQADQMRPRADQAA